MATYQEVFSVSTRGRGTYEITRAIEEIVTTSGIGTGTVHVFVQHTSAGVILSENADPDVRRDLETFMADLVPDGDPRYQHQDEGPDDMPAHVRSIIAPVELTLPVMRHRLGLGTWQGVYLWEHRARGHQRRIVVTVQGHASAE